jgi:hypothetical protein
VVAQGTNGDGSGGVDVLSDVELVSFNATPDHIGAFGASQLAWKVEGPQTGFHVTLNGATVTRAGGEIVQPQATTSYHLSAVSAGVTKALRTLTVQVSDAGCEINSLFNPQVTIMGFLNAQIEATSSIYFNADTEVMFSPGTIRFKLHLGKRLSHSPDPSIEIDVSLGLAVANGHISSVVQSIYADVSLPWYVMAVYGALAEVQLQLSNANADAQRSAQELAAGIGSLIEFISVPSNQTLVKRSVRIGVDDNGHGTIDIQACPNDLLVKLAEASVVGSTERAEAPGLT